jgi:hypothetical protein
MSNRSPSRRHISRISIAAGLIAALILLTGFVGFLITSIVSQGQLDNSPTIISIIFTLLGTTVSLVSILFYAHQTNAYRRKRKSPKPGELREATTTTVGIAGRLHLQAAEETNEELLTVEKQRLELEKQKTQLEREQQTIGWQKEALEVAQVSPRSAIVVAWIGVEQELSRTSRRLNLSFRPGTNIAQLIFTIKVLNEPGYITQAELETLKRMQEVRNRVVHGDKESVPTVEEAIGYIQDAINITKKLASIEERKTTA